MVHGTTVHMRKLECCTPWAVGPEAVRQAVRLHVLYRRCTVTDRPDLLYPYRPVPLQYPDSKGPPTACSLQYH